MRDPGFFADSRELDGGGADERRERDFFGEGGIEPFERIALVGTSGDEADGFLAKRAERGLEALAGSGFGIVHVAHAVLFDDEFETVGESADVLQIRFSALGADLHRVSDYRYRKDVERVVEA